MTSAPTATLADARPDGLARVEDHRLLTGRGQYVHDVKHDGMLHAVFVRSVHASALLRTVDATEAEACEGVVAVLSAEQLAGLWMPAPNGLLPGMQAPASALLPSQRVDAVGQPIALVLAESLAVAQHAAELVWVDYEPQPAQPDLHYAAKPVAQVRHQSGDRAAADALAVHRVSVDQQQPRVIAMSLEPRATVATWDAGSNSLTVWLPSQSPARARNDIARTLGLPPERVRVIAPDVGGSFGA